MLHIKLNGITNSKYVARRPPQRPCGSKGQNSTFSEQCHVAYQIKGNHDRKYFARRPSSPPPTHTHRPLGWDQNSFFFQNKEMLHIKLNEITKCSNIVAIFCPKTPLPKQPWGSKAQYSNFSEDYHVPYIIKFNGITNAATWQ